MKLAEITPVFNHNGYLNKRGESKIHIRVYYKTRKLVSTGISIEPGQWDETKSQVRGHRLKDTYNRTIKRMMRQYEENAEKLLQAGRPYTIQDILTLHDNPQQTNISFTEFVTLDIEKRTDLKPGTLRGYKVFLKRLGEFRIDVEFRDLTYSWLLEFESFLKNYTFTVGEEKKEQHLQLTRIDKYLKTLHACINRAIKLEQMEAREDPFKRFEWTSYRKAARLANTKRKYIDPEGVQRLELLKFDDKTKHLESIRDFFLFQCYTGLSYGDMIRLTKDNLQHKMIGDRAGYALKVYRQKSEEPSYIPIYLMDEDNRAEKILRKYMDDDRDLIFDKHTGEHINRELKIIGKMANITENLSTHVGRHTCAMWLLHKGLDMHHIKQILGHRKISTTEIYAMMDDKAVDQAFINLQKKNG